MSVVTEKRDIKPFSYIVSAFSLCYNILAIWTKVNCISPTHLYMKKPVSSPIASTSLQSLWGKNKVMWNMMFAVQLTSLEFKRILNLQHTSKQAAQHWEKVVLKSDIYLVTESIFINKLCFPLMWSPKEKKKCFTKMFQVSRWLFVMYSGRVTI